MKVFNSSDVPNINGTYKVGSLSGVRYNDLVSVLGLPTFDEPSGDDKVQKEWVIEYNGGIFTVYDWKTFDEEYTMNELDVWSIGGKSNCDDLVDFLRAILQSTI